MVKGKKLSAWINLVCGILWASMAIRDAHRPHGDPVVKSLVSALFLIGGAISLWCQRTRSPTS